MLGDALYKKITELSNLYKIAEPYSECYGNLPEKLGNYIVFKKNHTECQKNFKWDSDKFSTFNDIPNPKYSTVNILVYQKENFELHELINSDYYRNITIGNVNTLKNITKYYSEIYFKYIILPTVVPYFDNILFILQNNTSYDFYYDPKFIMDMYNIFENISKHNKTTILVNSLEIGSLPDVYHFHIIDSYFDIDVPEHITKNNVFYELDNINEFAKCYVMKNPTPQSLIKIPYFLYSLRYYQQNKYSGQLFFFKNNKNNYILISFRKAAVKNITLNKINGKYYMNDNYYTENYGKFYDNTGIIYYPCGLISVNTSKDYVDILNKIVSNHIPTINKMKNVFHWHPTFTSAWDQLKYFNSDVYVNINIPNVNDICFNIGKELEPIINKQITDRNITIKCNDLPVLYEITGDSGSINIPGNIFFYKIIDADKHVHYINKISKFDNSIFVPKFICSINKALKNKIYLLFSEIKTTLDIFIDYENYFLKENSSIINYIILDFFHNLIKLYERTSSYKFQNLSDVYIGKNSHDLYSYMFDSKNIITVSKEIHDYPINHNGIKTYLNIDNIEEIQFNNLFDVFYDFISRLYIKCNQFGISNMLLSEFYNNKIISIKDFIKKMNWAVKIIPYRAQYHSLMKDLEFMYDIKNSDTEMIYRKISKIIIENNNFDINEFSLYTVNKGDVFMNGTSQNITNHDGLLENLLVNNFSFLYFVKDGALENLRALLQQITIYMKTDQLSRLLFMSAIKDFQILNLTLGIISFIKYSNILYTQCVKIYGENINKIFEFNSDDDEIKMSPEYSSLFFDPEKNEIVFVMEKLQDLFNFALNIKYPHIAGYTVFLGDDGTREYVFNNRSEFFKLISVVKPIKNNILVFPNYKTYIESFIDHRDDMYYNDLSEYSMNLLDILADNSNKIQLINKKLAISDFDFFTRPVVPNELLYIDYKYKKSQIGGEDFYNRKYLKYKSKYIDAKKRINRNV